VPRNREHHAIVTAAPFGRSLWEESAPPAPEIIRAEGGTGAEVLIVGGGIVGLSCALRLAKQGAGVAVIDGAEMGFGASGRAGGQVIPGLKHDPDDLARTHGEALVQAVAGAAEKLFELAAAESIDCAAVRTGWIQAAHLSAKLPMLEARVAQWQRRGADVAMLSAAEVERLTGTRDYLGGWVDRRGGTINPLSYTRGLARAALKAGAALHPDSRAVSIERDGRRWIVRLRHGATFRAEQVVLATNGYSDDLLPGLKETVIPASSFQVATAPLPADQAAHVLPDAQSVSDTRRVLLYFRRGPKGELVMGGRGKFAPPTGPRDYRHIEAAIARLYPALAALPITHRWAGRVALTQDFMPHFHEPAPGITAMLGCNGRGLALGTTLGTLLADRLAHGANAPFPLAPTAIAAIPLHRFHRATLGALIRWYRFLDALRV
jgi:glycine/D-amino acid oxidase-like deaminating enzyme